MPLPISSRTISLPGIFLLSFAIASAAQQVRGQDAPVEQIPLRAIVQLVAVGPATGDQSRLCAGTGFFVSADGYLVTNAHVVEEARRCLAASPQGKILAKSLEGDEAHAPAVPCEVVAVDAIHDLALLRATRPLYRDAGTHRFDDLQLDEASQDGAREGDVGKSVTVIGHTAGVWRPVARRGRVVEVERLAVSLRSGEASRVLVLDVPLEKGASGSPVLDAGGRVVAVVTQKDAVRPDHTVAVSARYAVELLERAGVRGYSKPK